MSRDEIATEHETAFVRSFIISERQARYLEQLASPKKRKTFLDRLNHRLRDDLDARFLLGARPRVSEDSSRHCYVIADEAEHDGKLVPEVEVADVLRSAYFGMVISFIPGKLACYKGESPTGIVWMQRK